MMTKAIAREISKAISTGLKPLRSPPPLRLSEWAERHFYLSAESSYAEGHWRAYPYQVAILDAMGNDDIREVIWQKAARTGYTKCLLAAMGYFGQHRRRNQALWQPTDDDRDEFCKTELNPMLRDVAIMRDVFPDYLSRNKDNTLQQKIFLGSTVHLRGGKAAKNYRRMTVDVAILDELDGFDIDVEKEGSPDMLAEKRLEGATFPKLIAGSTPKLKGFSLIESREENADMHVAFHVPCPHCDGLHPLTWGGKDVRHGLKWDVEDIESVRHECPHCHETYTQAEYLQNWQKGRWISRSGIWIDDLNGAFRTADNDVIHPPASLAFVGLWTAYSPQASWSSIVRDWIAVRKKAKAGDTAPQKTFTNTTLGLTWEEDVERTDSNELARRAENYPLRKVPLGGLVLVAGVDVQDDRFELVTWAIGRGEEMWAVDYSVVYANPADERDWDRLDAYLLTEFPHTAGGHLKVESAAVDTGGHFTHQAYNFCRQRSRRRVFAIKGDNKQGSPIKGRASRQDVNWAGKVIKRGVQLWHVGVDTAKDLLYGRLQITDNGPGRVHFSQELPPDFYAQLTAESRMLVKTSTGDAYRWVKPPGARNEVLDCTVYSLFAAHALDLHRYTARQWQRLEDVVQPRNGDLFAGGEPGQPQNEPLPSAAQPIANKPLQKARRPSGFVNNWR